MSFSAAVKSMHYIIKYYKVYNGRMVSCLIVFEYAYEQTQTQRHLVNYTFILLSGVVSVHFKICTCSESTDRDTQTFSKSCQVKLYTLRYVKNDNKQL